MPEAGSARTAWQGRRDGGKGLAADRTGTAARSGRPAPTSEELARLSGGPEGLELRERPTRLEEDEISLVDLWLVLARRRFILAAVVLACVLGGLLFAFLQPLTYAFTTTIQIGRIVVLRGVGETAMTARETLEPLETVVAKLNEGYIPKILAAYGDEADEPTLPKIEASSPKRSQLILIKSKAPTKDSELHMKLHKMIVDILLEDHSFLIGDFRQSLELQLTLAQKKYNSLADGARVLADRLDLQDGAKALLEKQIGEIQNLLSATASGLARALPELGGEAKALTFLMVGTEIQQNRNRLATLEERVQIGLPAQRSAFEKQLADVERDMATQQERVSAIETRASSIRETRVIVGPARAREPVGPGRAVILALAAVLGLILGIFAAFFAEFLAKVRAAMAERENIAAREPAVGGR